MLSEKRESTVGPPHGALWPCLLLAVSKSSNEIFMSNLNLLLSKKLHEVVEDLEER